MATNSSANPLPSKIKVTTKINFKKKLTELRAERNRIEEIFRKELSDLRNTPNSTEKQQELKHQQWFEVGMATAEIESVRSMMWRDQGRKYEVPSPPDTDEYWTDYEQFGIGKVLSINGVEYVRNRVREEQAHARKIVFDWILTLSGFVGMLTGLAAVLMQWGK